MKANSKSKKSQAVKAFDKISKSLKAFLARRPHRSFRVTKRRDYKRSLKLPGLFAFTIQVNKELWRNRRVFLLLGAVYAALTIIAVGISSQDSYSYLVNSLREAGSEVVGGDINQLTQAGLVFLAIMTNGLSGNVDQGQQVTSIILILLVWLTTVWLLRNIIAGHKVKMRDGLYNAGAPIVPTFMLAVVLVFQAIPAGLAFIGYTAAMNTGLLNSGVEAMLFWVAAGLLVVLSLYLMSGTFFAMIVATLPGMYPFKALKIGGDLVVGRRLRILGRLLWMLLCALVGWAVVALPFIVFDAWLKGSWAGLEWLPIVPVVILVLGVLSVIWISAYIYMLYRKVVEDDAEPA